MESVRFIKQLAKYVLCMLTCNHTHTNRYQSLQQPKEESQFIPSSFRHRVPSLIHKMFRLECDRTMQHTSWETFCFSMFSYNFILNNPPMVELVDVITVLCVIRPTVKLVKQTRSKLSSAIIRLSHNCCGYTLCWLNDDTAQRWVINGISVW